MDLLYLDLNLVYMFLRLDHQHSHHRKYSVTGDYLVYQVQKVQKRWPVMENVSLLNHRVVCSAW